MNSDIRIALNFYDHPKTKRLIGLVGETATIRLQKLWIYAAEYYPKGILKGMTDEDWKDAFGFSGMDATSNATSMREVLIKVGFIDVGNGNNVYKLHDWREHNPYAFFSKERKVQAQKAAKARWSKRVTRNADSNADSNAPSPAPIPAPSPTPAPIADYVEYAGEYRLAVLTKINKSDLLKIKNEHPKLNMNALLRSCDMWHQANKKQRKDHYRAFQNWIKKHYEFQDRDNEKANAPTRDSETDRLQKKYRDK